MSIAASLAILVAAVPAAAGAVDRSAPPIVINVSAVPDVPASLMRLAQDEADEIFRPAGIRFVWRPVLQPPLTALHVIFGNEAGPSREPNTPLGWLNFASAAPAPEIYISYANAIEYLELSRPVVGPTQAMPRRQYETLLGRAMGRALAHELGHYLLATTSHTRRGLLKGNRSAQEFFSRDQRAFAIAPAERRQLVARLSKRSDLARRDQ